MSVINLNTEENTAPTINLDTGDQNTPLGAYSLLDQTAIKNKAARFSYAVPELKQNQVEQQLKDGGESSLRTMVADKDTAAAADARYRMTVDFTSKKNGPLTPADMSYIDMKSGYNFPYSYPRDPATIFETRFGKQWATDLTDFASQQSDSNFWNYGQMEPRNDYEAALIYGSAAIATHHHDMALMEALEDKRKNEPWYRRWSDVATMSVPMPFNLMDELKLRGNIPDVGWFEGFNLGANLEAQRQWLENQPYEVASRVKRKVVEALAENNTVAAQAWLMAMQGQSFGEYLGHAVGTFGGLLDVAGVGASVGAVGWKTYKAAQLTKLISTSLKGANSVDATRASILSSLGDAKGAAVENTFDFIGPRQYRGTITPTEEALRTLPENMNIFANQMTEAQKAGLLTQTLTNNMLFELNTSSAQGLTLLTKVLRPTVIDPETLTKDQIKLLRDHVIKKYDGDQNRILQVYGPHIEPVSRTPYWTLWFGDRGATFFEDMYPAAEALMSRGFRVSLDKVQLGRVEADIAKVRQELKDLAPHPEDDVHGLNFYDKYSKNLQETIDRLENFKKLTAQEGGARIGQQGLMYYGEFAVPMRLQDRITGQMFIEPDAVPTKKSISQHSYVAERVRTSEDTFSENHNAMRKASLFPQAVFDHYAFQQMKGVRDFFKGKYKYDPLTGEENPFWGRHNLKNLVPGVRLLFNKESRRRLNETFEFSQKNHDPVTGRPGWDMTPEQLNHHYVSTYGEPPTMADHHAYATWVKAGEFQRWLTQVAQFRGQAQRGNLTHRWWIDKDGEKIYTPEVPAQHLDRISGHNGTVLVLGPDLRTTAIKTVDEELDTPALLKQTGRISLSSKEMWQKALNRGEYGYAKLDNPEHYPFESWGKIKGSNSSKPYIEYVLYPIQNGERSALRWDSVPRTGGGRFIYDYPLFIKYPNMLYETVNGNKISRYLGDHTIAPIRFESLGREVVDKLNKTIDLLELGKETEAKRFYKRNGMEGALEPWKTFRKKFGHWEDEDGTKHFPLYNIKDRFALVSRGKSILDQGKDLQRRFGPSGKDPLEQNTWRNSLASNPELSYNVQFTQHRGDDYLQSIIQTKFDSTNPVYKRTQGELIDPLTMLNRGMRSTIKSLFMDDYKTYAVNTFMREASKYLVKTPDERITGSPFYHFKTLTRSDFTNEPLLRSEVNRLWSNKLKIDQFINTPTELDSAVYATAQKLADWVYRKAGARTANNKVFSEWMLPALRDPTAFIRSVTFNAKLGLFAPAQLLVQSMNYVTMFAVSPRHAITGTYGAFLRHLAEINPAMEATLDKFATKMKIPGLPRYKPGEFTETLRELRNSGFDRVGREVAVVDSQYKTKVVTNGVDTFLELGRTPFKWGETNSRVGAYFIAMKEFRTDHPNKVLTDTDRRMILNRADLLHGNMTSASHSLANESVWSTMSQFYMYAIRLAEIFWSGSRLGGTTKERALARARLFAVHGAMFGLPMAFGVTGFPGQDLLRKAFIDNGYLGLTAPYVPGDNWITTWINEGVVATAMAMTTGRFYNVGPRFGLGGANPAMTILDNDHGLWDALGGASVKLSMNVWNNGMLPMAKKIMQGDWGDIDGKDVINLFKEVTTVGDANFIAYSAFTTGEWLSKNWEKLDELTKKEATAMMLTGIRPTLAQQDNWIKSEILKGEADAKKWYVKQFKQNMNYAFEAQRRGDEERAAFYRGQAMRVLPAAQFSPLEIQKLMKSTFKDKEPLADRMDRKFFHLGQTVPAELGNKRLDQFRRSQRVKEEGYR